MMKTVARFVLLTLAFLSPFAASAHPFLQNAMWVLCEQDRALVAVNVSLREICVAQGISADENSAYDGAAIDAASEKHAQYLLAHLQLSAGGKPATGRVTRINSPPIYGAIEQTFYQYELEYPFPSPQPATVALRQDMLREFSYSPGVAWDVSYMVRIKRSDLNEVQTGLLRAQTPTDFPTGWSESAAEPLVVNVDSWRTFRDYLWHGIHHIITGYDHLLFVTALVLAAVSFWEMVKVIVAFTLAHTITLILSVLDLIRLPSSIVEPIIAGSIVFVAIENIIWPRRTHGWFRLGVAFVFGLVHGLGFAGGLLEAMAELPTIGIAVAIIAFSIGVEIGHQVAVLPVFGLMRLGDRMSPGTFRQVTLRYGSLVISALGAYYLFHAVTSA